MQESEKGKPLPSPMDYSLWGCKESDTTEAIEQHAPGTSRELRMEPKREKEMFLLAVNNTFLKCCLVFLFGWCFFFFPKPCLAACRIYQSGIELGPKAVKACLNHATARKVSSLKCWCLPVGLGLFHISSFEMAFLLYPFLFLPYSRHSWFILHTFQGVFC